MRRLKPLLIYLLIWTLLCCLKKQLPLFSNNCPFRKAWDKTLKVLRNHLTAQDTFSEFHHINYGGVTKFSNHKPITYFQNFYIYTQRNRAVPRKTSMRHFKWLYHISHLLKRFHTSSWFYSERTNFVTYFLNKFSLSFWKVQSNEWSCS